MSSDDRRELLRLINEWNTSRLEIFVLSQPDENLEFYGVMRFYFQDSGEKVSTKCIRVDSTASTNDVIKVLIEKFRPDLKTLSTSNNYAIYEVYSNCEERRLGPNERPLWVQLEWGKDGREGRFLLKNENATTVKFEAEGSLLRDKKRQSKREKKKAIQESQENNATSAAKNLYKEVPESNFTRSISNPEIVMARRRQQKLENKLKQIKNRDGGGTLKVFGETLKSDIPYKTLLMSNHDTAAFAVKETLEKYGLPNEDPINYCLVEVISPTREDRDLRGAHTKEFILEDEACPLAILMQHPPANGSIIFQIRKCPPDLIEKRKMKLKQQAQQQINDVSLPTSQSQQPVQQQQRQIENTPQRAQANEVHRPIQDMHKSLDNGPPIRQHNQLDRPQNRHLTQVDGPQRPVEVIQRPDQLQLHQQQQQLEHQSKQQQKQDQNSIHKFPFLVEVKNQDHGDMQPPKLFFLKADVCEVGCRPANTVVNSENFINLPIQGVQPKHCLIKTNGQNIRTIIPFYETYLNGKLIREENVLHTNFVIGFGRNALFRYIDTNLEPQLVQSPQQPVVQIPVNKPQQKLDIAPTTSTTTNYPSNYGVLFSDELTNREEQPQPVPQQIQKNEPSGIPGLVEFHDDTEDALLAALANTNPASCQFKLAPVYTMYMMLRYMLSKKYYLSTLSLNEKLEKTVLVVHKIVGMIRDIIEKYRFNKILLAFWLANSSEFLFFIKQDLHLNQVNYDAQEILADCVQIMFRYLVQIIQSNLDSVLSAFIDPSDHVEDVQIELNSSDADLIEAANLKRPTLKQVIRILNETMNLLRGFRVNAALTIQLFSQLFHYISVWLFNKLVLDNRSGLCSCYWGAKLSRRLSAVHVWAEKQGLELAADCHLARINQAAYLLQTPKNDVQELSSISSNCFALNSLQIKCILKNYITAQGEPPLSYQLVNNLISIAQSTADELLKNEGKELEVKEEMDLQLPFLLPEDGHSCDMIKGLPIGLVEYLENLQNMGFLCLWQNSMGTGSWTEYMYNNNSILMSNTMIKNEQNNKTMQSNKDESILSSNITKQLDEPLVVRMSIAKKNGGLGLSIVAAKPQNQANCGIYIKSVVSGGAADLDGRLEAGDLLLAVDEHSLMGITQEKAAEILTKSGQIVTLTVAKNAAVYYGLDALLNKPSSPMTPEFTNEIENTFQIQQQNSIPRIPFMQPNQTQSQQFNSQSQQFNSQSLQFTGQQFNNQMQLSQQLINQQQTPQQFNNFQLPPQQQQQQFNGLQLQPIRKQNLNEYESLANSRTLPHTLNQHRRPSIHELHMRSHSHEMLDEQNTSTEIIFNSNSQQSFPLPPLPHELQTRHDYVNNRPVIPEKPNIRPTLQPPPLEMPQQQQQQKQFIERPIQIETKYDIPINNQVRQIPVEIQTTRPLMQETITFQREDNKIRQLPQEILIKNQQPEMTNRSPSIDYTNRQILHEMSNRNVAQPQIINHDINQRSSIDQQNRLQQEYNPKQNQDLNNRFETQNRQILQDMNNRPMPQMMQHQEINTRLSSHYDMNVNTDSAYQQNKQNLIEHKQMPQTERYIERDINLIDNFNKTLKIVGYTPLKESHSNIHQISPNKTQLSTTSTSSPKITTNSIMMSPNLPDEMEFNEHPTPSVIGAHEVYLDPRTKKLQLAQKQRLLDSDSVEGEKLSFKDKMKLFDKEIQEQADKLKASKKQREIELKMN